jgi:hypothetical protein
MLVTQLSPLRPRRPAAHRHDGDILCDQSRIEAIVLGQDATGV